MEPKSLKGGGVASALGFSRGGRGLRDQGRRGEGPGAGGFRRAGGGGGDVHNEHGEGGAGEAVDAARAQRKDARGGDQFRAARTRARAWRALPMRRRWWNTRRRSRRRNSRANGWCARPGGSGRGCPIAKVRRGIDKGLAKLGPDNGIEAAKAIMTSDTRRKEYAMRIKVDGRRVTIGGMAEGDRG